jgi:hypothetical protein
MDEESNPANSRRSVLNGIAVVTLIACAPGAFADGKLTKAAVKYQDKPNAGKDCDDCLQFVPAATPKANGQCKVVEGVVSPHGYCAAFTPKPKPG